MLSMILHLAIEMIDVDDYFTREKGSAILYALPWDLIKKEVSKNALNGSLEVQSRCRLVYLVHQSKGHRDRPENFGVDVKSVLEFAFDAQDPDWISYYSTLPFRGADGVTLWTRGQVRAYWRQQVNVLISASIRKLGVIHGPVDEVDIGRLKGWNPEGDMFDFEYLYSNNYHAYVTIKGGRITGGVIW